MSNEELNIVYEDNHLLVVVKPNNIPVMADSSKDLDLLSMLKNYLVKKYDKPGEAFLGLVHRLDRPTGGIMVFAKTSKCAKRLQEQIQNGDMEKSYLAVLDGVPKEPAGKLVNYLKKNEKTNEVRVVPSATVGAKRAELDYKVLEEKDGISLARVKLITGRGHQIRVQMAHIGCPLVGDMKYNPNAVKNKSYLGLWAYELKLNHPITNETMTFRVYPDKEVAPWRAFDLDKYLSVNIKNIY